MNDNCIAAGMALPRACPSKTKVIAWARSLVDIDAVPYSSSLLWRRFHPPPDTKREGAKSLIFNCPFKALDMYTGSPFHLILSSSIKNCAEHFQPSPPLGPPYFREKTRAGFAQGSWPFLLSLTSVKLQDLPLASEEELAMARGEGRAEGVTGSTGGIMAGIAGLGGASTGGGEVVVEHRPFDEAFFMAGANGPLKLKGFVQEEFGVVFDEVWKRVSHVEWVVCLCLVCSFVSN